MAKPPSFLAPFLWSYDLAALDLKRDKKVIISQVIKYGDLNHWRWLIEHYGKEEVRRIITQIPETDLRPSLRQLLKIIFGIEHFLRARRGAR